jgi:hypothetical protein
MDGGPKTKPGLEGCNDARTGMPPGKPGGAMCVQRFDDSRNSAIHITYRISLRSSSMPEPRDPLLKVFRDCVVLRRHGFRGLGTSGRPGGRPKQQWFGTSRVESGRGASANSVMILPQVHLRKPCYDFYFL